MSVSRQLDIFWVASKQDLIIAHTGVDFSIRIMKYAWFYDIGWAK